MKLVGWLTIGASALALAACGHKDENVSTNMATNTAVTETEAAPAPAPGQDFANKAASSDAFEIATSQLAATQAKSPAIKKFAEQMIKAHTDSTAKLKATAAALTTPITPDPTLTTEQQAKIDALKALTGSDFDKAYASAQVDAHQQTLDAVKDYSANGDVPQFKQIAASLVPVVTAHLNMAKGLKP